MGLAINDFFLAYLGEGWGRVARSIFKSYKKLI